MWESCGRIGGGRDKGHLGRNLRALSRYLRAVTSGGASRGSTAGLSMRSATVQCPGSAAVAPWQSNPAHWFVRSGFCFCLGCVWAVGVGEDWRLWGGEGAGRRLGFTAGTARDPPEPPHYRGRRRRAEGIQPSVVALFKGRAGGNAPALIPLPGAFTARSLTDMHQKCGRSGRAGRRGGRESGCGTASAERPWTAEPRFQR